MRLEKNTVIDELKDNQEDSGTPTRMAGDIIREVLPYLQVFPEDGTQIDPEIYEWGLEAETESEGTDEEVPGDESGDVPDESDDEDRELTYEEELAEFLSQWVDEDQDGYDDWSEEYYWDDLAEFMESHGISTE